MLLATRAPRSALAARALRRPPAGKFPLPGLSGRPRPPPSCLPAAGGRVKEGTDMGWGGPAVSCGGPGLCPRPRLRVSAGNGRQLPFSPLSLPLPPLAFFAPDSRLPTSPRHFSLFFTPPSTPALPRPQAFPKLSEAICPLAFPFLPPSLFSLLLSPLLPTSLLVGPPPSAFPSPARASHAKASRKSLGQAAHSRPRASCPGPPSSSCLQRDLPQGCLSPCPLQEWRVLSLMKARDPFFHPFCFFQQQCLQGCSP